MFKKLRERIEVKAEQKGTKIIFNHFMDAGVKNWHTTLMGIIEAVILACIPIVYTGDFDVKTQWPFLLAAIARAVSGYLAKDATGNDKETAIANVFGAVADNIPNLAPKTIVQANGVKITAGPFFTGDADNATTHEQLTNAVREAAMPNINTQSDIAVAVDKVVTKKTGI